MMGPDSRCFQFMPRMGGEWKKLSSRLQEHRFLIPHAPLSVHSRRPDEFCSQRVECACIFLSYVNVVSSITCTCSLITGHSGISNNWLNFVPRVYIMYMYMYMYVYRAHQVGIFERVSPLVSLCVCVCTLPAWVCFFLEHYMTCYFGFCTTRTRSTYMWTLCTLEVIHVVRVSRFSP